MNIVEIVCSHMERPKQTIWNEERLIQEAQKYSTLKEFRSKSVNAYSAASKKRILEYVCSHMEEFIHVEQNNLPIKRLSNHERSVFRDTNEARLEAGFKPIEMRVRKCLSCGTLFESIGNRMCGCIRGQVTSLFGIEQKFPQSSTILNSSSI